MKRGYIWILVFLGIGTWFGSPHNGFSETTTRQTETYTLGEVVVSGKRAGVESVGTVREITADDIVRRRAQTLDQALELLPGLDIRTAGDGVPRVDLRGFRSRHVLLLLNGIPFNSSFDGQFDPSIIPVENIAKIKVSYGNHSVLYGQGGLGGVINVITKKGTEGLQGSAKLETGQRNRNLGSFTVSGAKNQFDAFVSASVLDSDGFVLANDFEATSEEDGGLRENSDKKHKNLFANIGYTPNDIWEIGLVANKIRGEFGKPPVTINDNTDAFASSPKYERIDNYDGFSGQISVNGNLPGPFGVRGWFFANRLDEDENRYDDNRYDSMDDPAVKNTYVKNNTTKIYGGTLQTSAHLKSIGLFTLSVSGEEQAFESEGIIRDEKAGGGTFNTRSFSEDRTVQVYSAAIEYEVSPFDRFGLVFGYSHHWLDKDIGNSDDDSGFLAGAHYDVFENTRVRGSVARKVRFPSIRQLYEEDTGNSDLNPEKSYNYELGVEQRIFEHTRLSLTGFYIDVKDYIEKIDSTDTFQNNDEYRFQGVELTAENRYFKNLLLRAGYTYMDTKDKSPDTQKEELQYRPEHKLTFETQYVFGFGLSAYAGVMYVADQYFYSRNAPLQKRKLNDYTLVDLKLDQAFLNKRLHVYLGVDNLFDRDYEESYGFPRAGSTLYVGTEYHF
ncbi:MAG: TonB-dependent receptor [Deltaproteobacteria bacterium]|nr:TonB-dependent receptor [Deltaproteobacteria bacterium]